MSEAEHATPGSAPPPRHSPLSDVHERLGATLIDFGGWLMPVRYTSDLAEHHAVRQAAGLFDVSHMAQFFVDGPDAGAYLDYALAGRLSTLAIGKAKYSLLLSESGGILDDVIVYRLDQTRFLVIANAANRATVAAALAARVSHDVVVDDATEQFALLAIQGPQARLIVEQTIGVTDLERILADLPYYAITRGSFAGERLLVARTGYTGEDGFELLVPAAAGAALWDALMTAGAPHGLVPAGLAARDTLRLEAGMPLYGHELSRDIVPAQAGLSRTVAADKESFVGKGALASIVSVQAPVLVGLTSEGRRAGRAGYAVHDGDHQVGTVTSGALSPTLGHPIALALVNPAVAADGTALTIDVRGTKIPATVTALPFYRRKK